MCDSECHTQVHTHIHTHTHTQQGTKEPLKVSVSEPTCDVVNNVALDETTLNNPPPDDTLIEHKTVNEETGVSLLPHSFVHKLLVFKEFAISVEPGLSEHLHFRGHLDT